MKLLLENWRKFVNEDEDATMEMGGKSWKEIESDTVKRARQGAEAAGFHFDRKLGKGQMGEVYLVENKKTGERNAMKHVVKSLYGGPKTSKREAQNYRFAMDNKASMPEKYAKYLPDVYNVEETVKDYFIFMELLEELPERLKSDLFALGPDDADLPRHEKYARIFKDPEAVYDIVNGSIFKNIILSQASPEVQEKIRSQVPSRVIKRIMDSTEIDWGQEPYNTLSDIIVEESMEYIKQDSMLREPAATQAFKNSLIEAATEILEKQIIPVHGGHGSHSYAGRSPRSIEDKFPEARDFIRAMKYFYEDAKWQPKDVHSQNVMMRPGTKGFVITDLGLFSLV